MDKKEEILEVAFYYFAKRGYHASMADIAKRAGLKTPSLYSHFDSKDQILWLTIEKEINHYFSRLDQVVESIGDQKTEEKLKQIFLAVFQYFSNRNRLKFWKNIPCIEKDELRKRARHLIEIKEKSHCLSVKEIFEQGVLRGELRNNSGEGTLYLYFAMMQGILDAILLKNADMEPFILKTWDAFWDGIKKDHEEQNAAPVH